MGGTVNITAQNVLLNDSKCHQRIDPRVWQCGDVRVYAGLLRGRWRSIVSTETQSGGTGGKIGLGVTTLELTTGGKISSSARHWKRRKH